MKEDNIMIKKVVISFLLILAIVTIAQNSHSLSTQQTLSQKDQKEIIEKISALLKNYYIFPEKAKEMGFELLKRADDGNYQALSDKESFAKQMTLDLQLFSHDKHLTVQYDPQRVKELRRENSRPSGEEALAIRKRRYEEQRRNNFGFQKVENLKGNIGYLDLRIFRSTDHAAPTAIGAMSFLSNSDAIIIDLRNNVGGDSSMYLLLISYFFSSQIVHLSDLNNRLTNSTQQSWTLPFIPGQRLPDVDLYILTSRRTFSAAEAFAYDLQCLKRATIIGQSTGGGAHMATRMIVNDDFYMFMPFAGAINPISKTNWEGVGVKPDVEVPEEKALDAAYVMALKNLEKKTTDQDWKNKLSSLRHKLEENK